MKNIYFLLLIFFLIQIQILAQTFTEIAAETGLDIAVNNDAIAVADYDNDGDLDVFLTNYHSFHPLDESTWNRLLRNNGDGTFEDVTMAAGFEIQFINQAITASSGEKLGASWGDYDNDGYPDLFLANSRWDQLYRNNGDGTFSDVTVSAGVQGCFECYSSHGLWFDHDKDGDLDLYVSILNGDNIFYVNNGDGTFTDNTTFYNLAGNGITWGTVAMDVGKDGFLDLYCANDTQKNEFFVNTSGQHYNESGLAYRVADDGAGMGLAIGDYNNDGFFDMYVTNIFNHLPNPLYKNLGTRRFENVAEAAGVHDTGWGWGTHFFDCDHDGDEDLAAVNGVVPDQYIEGQLQTDVQNYFFKNRLIETGNATFMNWSAQSHTNGDKRARGLEVFDYDGDGDLDMLVANVESSPYLYRNEVISTGNEVGKNWLQIKLEGTTSNRSAFGTEVKITFNGKSLYRWHHGGAFYGQSIKPVHFGVGESTIIEEIQLTWLGGAVETYYNVPVNQTIKIKEGAGLTNIKDITAPSTISNLKSFPNPFVENTSISFETNRSIDATLKIYNTFGQEVFQQVLENTGIGQVQVEWNGDSAARGICFYIIEFEGKRISGKIMKQ